MSEDRAPLTQASAITLMICLTLIVLTVLVSAVYILTH